MAIPIPSVEPLAFAAGESVQWTRTFANFPPTDGWTLTYYFAGLDTFQVAATTSGAGYAVLIHSWDTSGKPAGTYRWTAYVEQGTPETASFQRYPVADGELQLTINIATAKPGDFQTHEERTLAIIVAALENRLTAQIEDYMIAGKSVKNIPIVQLSRLRVDYAWAVWYQRHQGNVGADVAIAFLPPGGGLGPAEPVTLPAWLTYGRYGS